MLQTSDKIRFLNLQTFPSEPKTVTLQGPCSREDSRKDIPHTSFEAGSGPIFCHQLQTEAWTLAGLGGPAGTQEASTGAGGALAGEPGALLPSLADPLLRTEIGQFS